MALFKHPKKQKTNQRRRPGGANPPVFSYYSRGSTDNTENVGRRDDSDSTAGRYSAKLGHVPSFVALIAIVIAVGYSCLLQPETKIILVNDTNTVHRDPNDYKSTVQSVWAKSIFNRTKLTVNVTKLQDEIQAQFPELSDVKIELPLLGRRPTVVLTTVKPAMEFVNVNGVFYVDNNGKVMARTSELQKNELKDIPRIRDDSGLSAEPGKNIIPNFEAEYLSSLYDQLRDGKLDIESITLSGSNANEIDVKVVSQPYTLKFSVDSDPRQAVGTYLAIKSKFDAEGTVPKEYVDVRVEEKVFYR